MTSKDKVRILSDEAKIVLRYVRDLKANSKSTKKNKLTKIEKHQALLVDLFEDLYKAFEKAEKK